MKILFLGTPLYSEIHGLGMVTSMYYGKIFDQANVLFEDGFSVHIRTDLMREHFPADVYITSYEVGTDSELEFQVTAGSMTEEIYAEIRKAVINACDIHDTKGLSGGFIKSKFQLDLLKLIPYGPAWGDMIEEGEGEKSVAEFLDFIDKTSGVREE